MSIEQLQNDYQTIEKIIDYSKRQFRFWDNEFEKDNNSKLSSHNRAIFYEQFDFWGNELESIYEAIQTQRQINNNHTEE